MTWSSTNSFHQSDWDDDGYDDEYFRGDYDARCDSLGDDEPRFVDDDDARMRGWRPDPATLAPPPVALPHNNSTSRRKARQARPAQTSKTS